MQPVSGKLISWLILLSVLFSYRVYSAPPYATALNNLLDNGESERKAVVKSLIDKASRFPLPNLNQTEARSNFILTLVNSEPGKPLRRSLHSSRYVKVSQPSASGNTGFPVKPEAIRLIIDALRAINEQDLITFAKSLLHTGSNTINP